MLTAAQLDMLPVKVRFNLRPDLTIESLGLIELLSRTVYEQALVCLLNREIVDASRGWTFH